MPIRILVPKLVDAAQTNAQNLNAKALLSRFSDPSCHWLAAHYGDAQTSVVSNRHITLTRLWRRRLWQWHVMLMYMGRIDAIFYPGMHWFDDSALTFRRRFGWRTPIIATLEGLVGDGEREVILSTLAGHAVYCHRVEPKVINHVDSILHQADHIIAISPFLARMGSRLYGNKFSVLPLGIESKQIQEALSSSGTTCQKYWPTVICVGTVHEHKRPNLFLQLAEQFSSVHFRWIGEGPLREPLILEADKRGLRNLSFPGGRPPEGVIAELKAADIFVLPSRSEGVPKVTQEAAACGLPIIAFGYYEPPTVIDGENGYIVWSDEEFKLRLTQVLEDHVRRRAMGVRSLDLAKTWDWDRIAKQWEVKILQLIYEHRNQKDSFL